MSALPPKADIGQHGGNVRFVPQADIPAGFLPGYEIVEVHQWIKFAPAM
jgi:hypothetical protein